jgi:acetyl esterase/lipase
VSTKYPIAMAMRRGNVVPVYRATLARMALTFGRFPRGTAGRVVAVPPLRGEWVEPAGGGAERTLLYLHGGGYIGGAPNQYRALTGALALTCNARVFVPDYRLAPEHPFPAAIDDAVAAYEALLAQGADASRTFVGGDSAGGGLTLSLLLALRDRGTALPAGAILLSPWVDLAATGASIIENAKRDDVVVFDDGKHIFARMYAGEAPLNDPRASGLYADLSGLPPLLIQASSIEMLRDDAVRLAEKTRAAGGDARLRLWDGVQHVWQLFTNLPESREAFKDIADFVRQPTS